MTTPLIFKVHSARLELRAVSPDPSLPAAGELLAVASRIFGGEDWVIRVKGSPRIEGIYGEAATHARLGEIGCAA